MRLIDFETILTAAETDACEIQPPAYLPHNSNSTYFYVVRRANSCGYQERTLAASVRVVIDSNGELALLQPNGIFNVRAKQVTDDKVHLIWYYCPLDQESKPVCFKVYYDNGTGQVDYETALAVIDYTGRKFYNYQSAALEAGGYLFAIRAEDVSGTEHNSLAHIKIQLQAVSPDAIDILGTEAI